MERVIIYGRVSTDLQSYNYQVQSLRDYASKMNYEVIQEFTEKVSGLKNSDERKALDDLLKFIKINKVNRILCTEVSRLSRKISNLHYIIDTITQEGISIYFLNYNFETILNGKCNPFAHILIGMLGSFSEMELDTLKLRIAMGKANSSKKFGRKEGYRKPKNVFLQENTDVIKYLEKKYTIREVAKITEKSLGTIQKVKHLLAA